MPWLVATFVRYFIGPLVTGLSLMLRSRFGTWIVLAMTFLGVGFATQKVALEPIIGQLEGYANGAGGGAYGEIALATMGTLNVDIAISMLISAVLAKQAIGAARLFFVKK